ncbi:Retrovirus-related Pol polyprotein from transposon TNT 1-94 [Senna tora]|uniref:Retrovirus-related Pol polyprotein from transposon TNT 1-94 n=1 Tax=Senna tora TaxID=362788 RepID=A0A834T0N8_9FABA|nr:Retrovirus-related Pol polyprotein from transposon TNT 1-94 [Senna tora]
MIRELQIMGNPVRLFRRNRIHVLPLSFVESMGMLRRIVPSLQTGKYDGLGEQRPGHFARFLMECGIVPQYTILGTPSQNGVAERRNRTLKDMTPNATVTAIECPDYLSSKTGERHRLEIGERHRLELFEGRRVRSCGHESVTVERLSSPSPTHLPAC